MSKNSKDVQKRADAKREESRGVNLIAVFFLEDLPEDWKELINSLRVKWIESPVHDKDFDANGTPKKIHVHGLFMFSSKTSLTAFYEMFKELFGESETGSVIGVPFPKVCRDRCSMVRYFAHMDDPQKAQYDVADIIGHNGADVSEILRYSATETREMIVAIEEFIEDNKIVELSALSKRIRYDQPEWHTLVATKMTTYFTGFIRSRRHVLIAEKKKQEEREGLQKSEKAKQKSREAKVEGLTEKLAMAKPEELEKAKADLEKAKMELALVINEQKQFDEDGVLINDLETEKELNHNE